MLMILMIIQALSLWPPTLDGVGQAPFLVTLVQSLDSHSAIIHVTNLPTSKHGHLQAP